VILLCAAAKSHISVSASSVAASRPNIVFMNSSGLSVGRTIEQRAPLEKAALQPLVNDHLAN
jgi:hypothetical protein